jgi:hypothetical protein
MGPKYGSQDRMLLEILKVHVPPYWGVPRLFHQFPVEVVVADVVATAAVVDVVDTGAVDVTTADVVVVVFVVLTGVVEVAGAVVVDEEEQDANTIDMTMRKAKSPQNVPLFIKPPSIFVLPEYTWKVTERLYYFNLPLM